MGRFTDNEVEDILSRFKHAFISMHHENPETSDPLSSEITGGSYERSRVTFGLPAGRHVATTSQAKFSGLPAVTITHLGGWSHMINGDMRFHIELPSPLRVRLGQTVTWASGEIVLSID